MLRAVFHLFAHVSDRRRPCPLLMFKTKAPFQPKKKALVSVDAGEAGIGGYDGRYLWQRANPLLDGS